MMMRWTDPEHGRVLHYGDPQPRHIDARGNFTARGCRQALVNHTRAGCWRVVLIHGAARILEGLTRNEAFSMARRHVGPVGAVP